MRPMVGLVRARGRSDGERWMNEAEGEAKKKRPFFFSPFNASQKERAVSMRECE